MSTSTELCFMSATKLAKSIGDRSVSPVELVEAVLGQIELLDPKVRAYITVDPEGARASAKRAEQQIVSSKCSALPPLTGIPVSVKDLIDTQGLRTTYGSMHHERHVPNRDSLSWARLKAAGAILIGKTSTPPFGWLGVTENRLIGATHNPWKQGRTAGGSSGGAAAAVASGMGPLALGSDGGGSIRIPAAMCGTVGMKPSVGRIPIYPDGDIYDTVGAVGPLTRTVADTALMLSSLAGPHERDAYSLSESGVCYERLLEGASLRNLRIGFSTDLGRGPVAPDVVANLRSCAKRCEDLGAHVEEVQIQLPDPIDYFNRFWPPAVAVLAEDQPEALEDITQHYPWSREIVARGRAMMATDYWRTAIRLRAATHDAIATLFERLDLLLTPTSPVTAFEHPGPAAGPTHIGGTLVAHPHLEFHRFTEPFSHSGHPAISIPAGFDRDGLPFALQIVGRHRADLSVLRAAAAFEEAYPWATSTPPGALPL